MRLLVALLVAVVTGLWGGSSWAQPKDPGSSRGTEGRVAESKAGGETGAGAGESKAEGPEAAVGDAKPPSAQTPSPAAPTSGTSGTAPTGQPTTGMEPRAEAPLPVDGSTYAVRMRD